MDSRTALVGYDGSPQADRAIAVGASLLPAMDAMVATVWHTPPPSHALLQEILHEPEREHATVDELATRLREAGEAAASATAARGVERAREAGWSAQGVTRHSLQGVWFDLAALAGETGAQILVVGADGSAGPLGRVADALVRLSDRPVLVIREECPDPQSGAPLVIGYDGSAQAQQAIATAGSLFPGHRALVVHVGHLELAQEGTQLAAAAGLEAEALQVPQPAQSVVRPEGAAWHRLDEVAEQREAAAIVVGARGAGGLRRFMLGSVTGGLLHHARRPVLVVPHGGA